MQAMSVIRDWQFDILQKSLRSIHQMLQGVPQEHLTTYRDGGDGWTVVEVLCHLRDYDEVFLQRATLTMQGDYPGLPNPDPDQLATERRYNDQKPEEVIAAWSANREAFLGLLRGISSEDEWEQAGLHPRRGRFTLHDQLLLASWHDMNHIEQMTRILAEKRA